MRRSWSSYQSVIVTNVRRSGKLVAVSVKVSGGGSALRRVVIVCDAAGCLNSTEPPAAESWRSNTDATSWAREQASGWARGADGTSDYCPEHAALAAGKSQGGSGPQNRNGYAAALRNELRGGAGPTARPMTLTGPQAAVIGRLLDELAGLYRGEDLGTLAGELSAMLRNGS